VLNIDNRIVGNWEGGENLTVYLQGWSKRSLSGQSDANEKKNRACKKNEKRRLSAGDLSAVSKRLNVSMNDLTQIGHEGLTGRRDGRRKGEGQRLASRNRLIAA